MDKLKKVLMSLDFLCSLLTNQDFGDVKITNGLPNDAEIVDMEIDKSTKRLKVTFKSEQFPPLQDGESIPPLVPTFHKRYKSGL